MTLVGLILTESKLTPGVLILIESKVTQDVINFIPSKSILENKNIWVRYGIAI